MHQPIRVLFTAFLCLGWFSAALRAGTTGTLAGFVKNKSKEPLIGASVIVKDLGMGAATDEKGFYILNNVPAGTHTLTAKMMGFKTTTVSNVIVAMDLRTTTNITMESTVLKIAGEVTVTAERPLIQRDVTGTTRTVMGKEISDNLPINTFTDVIKLQPGVVEGHIRGGRETEILFLVDGLPVQQAISGGLGSNLPNTSVVDLSIQTGGFNAEYGNAMSGVVNAVTKSGGEKFQAQAKAVSEDFGVESLESEGTRRYELNLGGPWTGRGNFFLAGNADRTDTRYHQDQLLFHPHPIEENRNATGKLTYRFTPNMRLSAEGLYSTWHWYDYQYRWRNDLSGLPPQDKNSYRVSGTWTQSITPRMFYTLSGSQYTIRKEALGPDSTRGIVFDRTGNWVRYGSLDWKEDSKEIISIAKGDFTNQITPHYQIKAGGELTIYDLTMDSHKQVVTFSGDTTGNTTEDTTQFNTYETHYRYQPRSGSAYLQQKIEYEGMVVNAGLRYDFMDARAQRPLVEGGTTQRRVFKPIITGYTKASLKWQLSPRVGLALPISDRDFFFINYGYFFQMPMFEYLYTNLGYDYSGAFPISGDPDLKAERTIAWEMAYQRAVRKEYLISVTCFNKDISNLIDTKTYTLNDQEKLGYAQFVNLGLATVKGLELYLERRPTNLVGWKVAYTLMSAKGTSSSAGQGYNWYQWGVRVPNGDYYLSWDQRHTLVVNLDLRDERRWGVSSVLRLNSPLPYTRKNETPNLGRMRSRAYLDIKANRDLYWDRLRFSLFADCRNVLDNHNLLWVDADGNPGGSLKDPSAYSSGRRVTIGLTTTF